ncbi:MAG: NAD(P)/FAD-dependent oxidoreductase [Planctomycetes bacterium]|nr:NAD(P)/FAD-dependent oxidoreductase [Planctomycetota bacterium]
MAAIWAGRTALQRSCNMRVVTLDGATKLGAKILVAGGGRCNVTHDEVDESAFAGSTPAAIRKVLRRFDVAKTVEFFREQGVALKRETPENSFPRRIERPPSCRALLRAEEVGVETLPRARRTDRTSRQCRKWHSR